LCRKRFVHFGVLFKSAEPFTFTVVLKNVIFAAPRIKRLKGSGDGIHGTQSMTQFIGPRKKTRYLEGHNVDPLENKLAECTQNCLEHV
jgi:hypothetical protein